MPAGHNGSDVGTHVSSLEESLALALAAAEEQRLRVQRLSSEVSHLKAVLRKHDIAPGDALASLDQASREASFSRQESIPQQHVDQASQRAGAAGQCGVAGHAEYAATVLAGEVEVPGKIVVGPDGLQFMVAAANVKPDCFFGVQFFSSLAELKSCGTPRGAVSKPSWWNSLFASSAPTRDSLDAVAHGTAPSHAAVHPPPRASSGRSSPTAKGAEQTGVWQSKPAASAAPAVAAAGHPHLARTSNAASAAPADGRPPLPPLPPSDTAAAAPTTAALLADGIAAGLQEGLSSISQFTGYLSGGGRRRTPLGISPADSGHDLSEPDVQLGRASRRRFRDPSPHVSEADWESVQRPDGAQGLWQIMWNEDDVLRTLPFRTAPETRAHIQQMVEKWSDERSRASGGSPVTAEDGAAEHGGPKLTRVGDGDDAFVQQPVHLAPLPGIAPLSLTTSHIVSADEASAIASAIPGRRQMSAWTLKYTTESMGFSLQTLYRCGANCQRSMLLVEDFSGYVFGTYCTDPWRIKPRYQGTGECFVFQIRPHAVKYAWLQDASVTGRAGARNDFFMLLGIDSAGFGGAPHFALWLDSDLLYGNSGLCHTFASPQLAGKQDFKVKGVELWQVGT